MGALSGLLGIATSSLHADNVAIDTTAENIANQNTAGYSRRTVSWTENDTVDIGGYNIGNGTTATVIAHRDRVLERNLQQATDTASASSTRLSSLQNLESLFSLDSSGTDASGISTALSGFFSSISALSADPTGSSSRTAVLAAANTVADTFRSTSAQIAQQTSTLNQSIGAGVTQVNQLLTTIAGLNVKIGTASTPQESDSLEDQRTQAITTLSSLIGIHQTTTENNSISISTSDGTLLVGATNAYPLSTSTVGGNMHLLSSTGTDITNAVSGGSIGGNLQVRDQDIPAVQSQLDTIAFSFATEVNAQNQAGLTASGSHGSAIFIVGGSASGASAAISVSMASGAGIAAAFSGEGPGGSSNSNAILALQNTSTTNGETFAGAFGSLLSGLGTVVGNAKGASTADAAIQLQLSSQRDQVSGISLDDEAANLTQYQRSYQAAAKLLSILDTVMASAINIGVQASVS